MSEKYNPATGDWEESGPSMIEKFLPSAAKIQGTGAKESTGRILLGVLDVLGIPSRALAAATTGQKFNDPDAYAAKPLVEKFKARIDAQPEKPGPSYIQPNRGGVPSANVKMVPGGASKDVAKGVAEFAGRTLTDPLSLFGTGAAKRFGEKAMNKAVGLTQSQIKIPGLRKAAQNTMTPEQAKTLLDEFSSVRGLEKTSSNLSKAHDAVNEKFSELINQVAAKKKVDVEGTIRNVEAEVARLEKVGDIDLNGIQSLRDQLSKWREAVKPLTNQQGFSDFPVAQNFKTKTLRPVAKYDKVPGSPNPGELSGKAEAARMTSKEITDQMASSVPELRGLNKEFGKIAGLEKFVDPALEQATRNKKTGLLKSIALNTGVLGAGGAVAAGKPELAALASLPYLLTLLEGSPGTTAALYKAGKFSKGAGNALRPIAIERALESAGRSGD
jgi:hypothetical protein